MGAETFVNWAGTQRCQPEARFLPSTETEVRDLVRRARQAGKTLRAVGTGHSWSDVVLTNDWLVSLDNLSRVLELDSERKLVTVEAGIRLKDLNAWLYERGFALENLGSVGEQSIAGATATGTHGTGLTFGNLSTQLHALRIVTADSSMVDVSATENAELWPAVRVSLGCLGVVVRATVRVVPAFNIEEHAYPLDWDSACDRMLELAARHVRVKYWWLPHVNRLRVYVMDPTSSPEKPPSAFAKRMDKVLNDYAFTGVIAGCV